MGITDKNLYQLTEKERRIIIEKGTEKPFTGDYDDFYRDGIFLCRQCGKELFSSRDKFNADCGWPAFDDEINGAIKRSLDPDGRRTEITCANCGAHLGHEFRGEAMTPKNLRHCVNSLSLFFVPTRFESEEENFAVFGGGCFWCTETIFKQVKGVSAVISGYAGGQTLDPTYEAVSTGNTGHAEVIKIAYDPKQVTCKTLLEIFFAAHDPTTLNRQGNDIGTQYRSIILYRTLEQRNETLEFINELEMENIFQNKIVTEIKPLYRFYKAEDYHQDYYVKHQADNMYCQAVINPKLIKFKEKFKASLKADKK